jgi:hypothetical protein
MNVRPAFHPGGFQIYILGWIKIKCSGFGVVEPLAGDIQFLENVFDKAKTLVRAFIGTVVLPSPLQIKRPIGFLPHDPVMKASPEGGLQGVEIPPRGIGPAGNASGGG